MGEKVVFLNTKLKNCWQFWKADQLAGNQPAWMAQILSDREDDETARQTVLWRGFQAQENARLAMVGDIGEERPRLFMRCEPPADPEGVCGLLGRCWRMKTMVLYGQYAGSTAEGGGYSCHICSKFGVSGQENKGKPGTDNKWKGRRGGIPAVLFKIM